MRINRRALIVLAPLLAVTVLLASLLWGLRPRAPAATRGLVFDPARVAYFEQAGWEAYYDRAWPRAFWLLVQLNQEQFHMSWPMSLAAAYDTVRASMAFAPIDNDIAAAQDHLHDFYTKAGAASGLTTDAATLAALEMDYWIIHRKLANERKAAPTHEGDIEPMVSALVRLHAALFDAPAQAIRRSAELRAQAAKTVDRITGGYSTDRAGDWQQVRESLSAAYAAIRPVE